MIVTCSECGKRYCDTLAWTHCPHWIRPQVLEAMREEERREREQRWLEGTGLEIVK